LTYLQQTAAFNSTIRDNLRETGVVWADQKYYRTQSVPVTSYEARTRG